MGASIDSRARIAASWESRVWFWHGIDDHELARKKQGDPAPRWNTGWRLWVFWAVALKVALKVPATFKVLGRSLELWRLWDLVMEFVHDSEICLPWRSSTCLTIVLPFFRRIFPRLHRAGLNAVAVSLLTRTLAVVRPQHLCRQNVTGLQYVDLSYNQLTSVPAALMQCRPAL